MNNSSDGKTDATPTVTRPTRRTSRSRGSVLAVATLLAASCASPAASTSLSAATNATSPSAADIFFATPARGEGGERQCPEAWSYPEMVDGADTWVAAGCALCASTEPAQSPIDILAANASLSRDWPRPSGPHPASLPVALPAPPDQHDLNYAFKVADGMMMTWKPKPSVFTYTLDSFHFHVGSEHQIQGVSFDMEMHVKATTNVNGKNYYAVFAVLFSQNAPSANSVALAPVADAMQGTAGLFDLGALLSRFATGPSYTYTGTLTTPPCGPDRVQWFVLADVQYVDPSSLKAIGTAIHDLTKGADNVRLPRAWTPGRHLFLLRGAGTNGVPGE
ncbi:carbonic anhydrase family protein [Myxococcota bacterium]|nr:carbonic anhydrase family protein [Myxococcota bacterium]